MKKVRHFWWIQLICLCFSIAALANENQFNTTLEDIDRTMVQYHYAPHQLTSSEYVKIKESMAEVALTAKDKADFIEKFNHVWKSGPFSHVRLDEMRQPVDMLADYLDNMDVGGKGASLEMHGDVAVLTVNTMMGADTIEQINNAYEAISSANPKALIIDLRNNTGGAFAVRPLISHLISSPLDAGVFVSQKWHAAFEHPPTTAQVTTVEPWRGWSIKTFWEAAQNNMMTRVQFTPAHPGFSGPVYVLVSQQTASAAELAADALKSLPQVRVIGEKTAGQMLSQKMYDIEGGFQLYLPIADYYSVTNGRIEGKGVTPHDLIKAADALDYALRLTSRSSSTDSSH